MLRRGEGEHAMLFTDLFTVLLSGGFERFFQHIGTPTDHATKDQPPFIPDLPRMQAAAQQHNMQFMPDYRWPAQA